VARLLTSMKLGARAAPGGAAIARIFSGGTCTSRCGRAGGGRPDPFGRKLDEPPQEQADGTSAPVRVPGANRGEGCRYAGTATAEEVAGHH